MTFTKSFKRFNIHYQNLVTQVPTLKKVYVKKIKNFKANYLLVNKVVCLNSGLESAIQTYLQENFSIQGGPIMLTSDLQGRNDHTTYAIFDTSLHYHYIISHKNIVCNWINSNDYTIENTICCLICIIEFQLKYGGIDDT